MTDQQLERRLSRRMRGLTIEPLGIPTSEAPDEPPTRADVIVRQIRPGDRVRAPIRWRNDPVPLNSERNAALLFEIAIGRHSCPECAP